MGWQEGVVTLAGEEELDEEEEADGEVKAWRAGPALGAELAGGESAAGRLDLSRNGGCGGWEGAAGLKAEDCEGMAGAAGEGAVAAPPSPPPKGRAVLVYVGASWPGGLVYAVLGAG